MYSFLSCRYLHDVIYITLFVQLASIISEKLWWTYIVVRWFYLNFENPVQFLLITTVLWTIVEP
jgi:hypothetical protein